MQTNHRGRKRIRVSRPFTASLFFPATRSFGNMQIWARSEADAHIKLLSTFADVQVVGLLRQANHKRGVSPS